MDHLGIFIGIGAICGEALVAVVCLRREEHFEPAVFEHVSVCVADDTGREDPRIAENLIGIAHIRRCIAVDLIPDGLPPDARLALRDALVDGIEDIHRGTQRLDFVRHDRIRSRRRTAFADGEEEIGIGVVGKISITRLFNANLDTQLIIDDVAVYYGDFSVGNLFDESKQSIRDCIEEGSVPA